jgi:hypothetical protein
VVNNLTLTIDFERRVVVTNVDARSYEEPPQAFIAQAEVARILRRHQECTRRGMTGRARELRLRHTGLECLKRSLRTAAEDMMHEDALEAIRKNRCLNTFIAEHCELFDFPLRLFSGVVQGASFSAALWCLNIFIMTKQPSAIYAEEKDPVYVPADALDAWHVIFSFKRESALKHYVVLSAQEESQDELVEVFFTVVRAGVSWDALVRCAEVNEDFLPLLGWICAYLILIRVNFREFGPMVPIVPPFFETFSSHEMMRFKEGFGLVLDFDALLSVIKIVEFCLLLRKDGPK